MEVTEDYISNNLKVIGKIELNTKVCIRNGHVYLDTSWILPNLKRFVMGDDRYSTIEFIRTLIHNAFVLSDNLSMHLALNVKKDEMKYVSILKRLLTDLTQSVRGVRNLNDTYANDAAIRSKIEVLIDNLNVQTEQIRNTLRKYEPDLNQNQNENERHEENQ